MNATMNSTTVSSGTIGALGVSMLWEKVIVATFMMIVTLLAGGIPYKLMSVVRGSRNAGTRRRFRDWLSFLSCFSGGVFIGACLLDLLPDVEEKIDQVLEEIRRLYKVDVDYPLAQFIVVVGFIVILVIEQSVVFVKEKWNDRNSISETEPLLGDSTPSRQGYQAIGEDDHDHENHLGSIEGNTHTHSTVERQESITGVSAEVHHSHDGHGDHDHISHGVFEHSTLRSLLLLIALSFHSVFEGLAIGLQADDSQLLTIFIAVIAHKGVMAFSLGMNIAQSSLKFKSFVIAIVVFSLASPIGVLIGTAVADLPSSLPQNIANGVLQGMACGTFLYITFFEVLPHELNSPRNRMKKLFFVIAGYLTICAILFIAH